MLTVIMAGGKGTRIAEVHKTVPKPMIPILGKPILEYQLEALKRQGCREFVMIVGHLGKTITDYFGNGEKWGVSIRYIAEEEPLGTAGALFFLRDLIQEDFLLINGDVIFDVNLERFVRFHRERGGLATLFVHPNSHPYDSAVLVTDENGRVEEWLNKEDERLWYRNQVNAGLHMLSAGIFETSFAWGSFRKANQAVKLDLDRDILKPMVGTGKLFAYASPEYVKDMGTPERLKQVEEDIRSGQVEARNLTCPQKAVFLDRDGTINRYVGFLREASSFELLEGAAQAIREMNRLGYLAIVVTNQPVIARGEVSCRELRVIHNKMETLLGMEGAYLDAIYYCPHHPHGGYEGEIPQLKRECSCRKPKPGLLLKAADEFHIDLKQSWMVGDSQSDILAGKAAGCRTALIGGEGEEFGQNMTVRDLLEFVERALKE